MTGDFHDHFSKVAEGYARHRPTYPAALFDWLAAHVHRHDLAWDCATGSGQAAVGLAARFAHVVATDASAEQLQHAVERPNIAYRLAGAGDSGLEDRSADLVTCAQALHWLPRDLFFAEVRRVLAPGGLVAVWGYHIPLVGEPGVDSAIRHFHDEVVGPWWPPERKLVLDRFRTIDFPFDEVEAQAFEVHCRWSLADFARYLDTQSATDRYRRAHHEADPVPEFVERVAPGWGGIDATRDVRFPVFLRAGRL
jgi:ubiquinone/menaquinone biosynthesis C-methylase UbiE